MKTFSKIESSFCWFAESRASSWAGPVLHILEFRERRKEDCSWKWNFEALKMLVLINENVGVNWWNCWFYILFDENINISWWKCRYYLMKMLVLFDENGGVMYWLMKMLVLFINWLLRLGILTVSSVSLFLCLFYLSVSLSLPYF